MDGADFRTEFVRDPGSLRSHPALVLNADFRPLSYYPLSLWPWQEAIKAAWLDRVDIVAEYDEVVRSPSTVIKIPSVVVLKDYVKPQKRVAFTRFNLFLRDEFCCQYCGSKGDLTFDHVVPRARGGFTSWENVVAACAPCNLAKGSKSLHRSGLTLRRPPRQPSSDELRNHGRKFPPNHLHDSWVDYLYWDAELDA
jgi:5-methylcytosine-specific restriction endonuclease McrA